MTNREWLAQMSDKQFIKWLREYKYKTEMTNTERITNFCIEYFNKHDVNKDDELITSDDICIMSYTDIGMGWSATVYMPDGYIYELNTIDEYGTVAFNKYRKCGGSLYKWGEENSNEL